MTDEPTAAADNFDPRDFRRALGQFPTGVTVITARDSDGDPVGVTASSFNSVSIDPPLVLWSVDKGSHSCQAFEKAPHFVVNVLGQNQVETSNNFARGGADKFANASYSTASNGSPALDQCAAQFECDTWSVYEGGDHLIIVGQVTRYSYSDSTEPLVFARGSYAVSNQHPAMDQSKKERSADSGFIDNYLLYLTRVFSSNFSERLYARLNSECDITPEEWRILINLNSHDSTDIQELSVQVMQPGRNFQETVSWMVEKGLVEYESDSRLGISAQGREIAARMQAIASEEEERVLSSLDAGKAEELKSMLKQLLSGL